MKKPKQSAEEGFDSLMLSVAEVLVSSSNAAVTELSRKHVEGMDCELLTGCTEVKYKGII
jgi:hypothetical protein